MPQSKKNRPKAKPVNDTPALWNALAKGVTNKEGKTYVWSSAHKRWLLI